MGDIVVDTNVLLHATNPSAGQYFTDSIDFLKRLAESDLNLCVDEGFSLDTSKNRSMIGHEYLKHLQPASTSYQLLMQLALSSRISLVPSKVDRRISKIVTQVIRKKSDRVYLKVACNSENSTLTSHDFEDFSKDKRKSLKKKIGVTIACANECICE